MAFAFVVLLAATGSAFAQSLWQHTKAGMSVAEVKALYPDAQAGSKRAVNGATEDLRLGDYAIVDRRFSVGFWFGAGRLERVILEAAEADSAGRAANLATYAKLLGLLSDKYGSSNCQIVHSTTLLQSCGWTTPTSKIDLVYVDIGDQPVLLNIYYRARNAEGGGRHRFDGERL